MENIETTKIKAQGKVRLLTVVVVLLVLTGAVVEYRRLNAPKDEMVVVYKTAKKVEKIKEFTKAEDVKPVVTVKAKGAEVNLDNAVENFFDYFDKVREDLDSVVEPASVLDNIVQEEVVEVKEKAPEVFEEGKIEIYDSEKGVVATEEVPVVNEEPVVEVDEVKAEENVEVQEEAKVEAVVEEVPADEAVDDEEVPLDEVPVEVVEEVKEVSEAQEVQEQAPEVIEEVKAVETPVVDEVKETVEEAVEEKIEEAAAIVEEVVEDIEEDVSKAKSAIENINVDIDNADFVEEVAGGSGDSVTMKFGEGGISIEGPDGVALKIDENGLSISGFTVDMPIDESESEKELDENAEAIVNKFKNINNSNIKDVEDEAINLLQGINMQNN